MTVERQAGLGAQGVARAQPDRFDAKFPAGLEHGIPEIGCPLRMDKQFEGHLLARIAGAGNNQIEAAHFGVAQFGALERQQAFARRGADAHGQQHILALWALQRNIHAHIRAGLWVAQVADDRGIAERAAAGPQGIDLHFAVPDGFQPGPVLVVVGGVDHHEEFVHGPPVNQRVVDDIGIRVEQVRIERLARPQRADRVGAEAVQEGGRIRTLHLVDAHVRNVEQAGGLAGGQVLFHYRRIPDRHFPAGERDHFCAKRFMDFIERGLAQRRFGLMPFEIGQCLSFACTRNTDKPGFLSMSAFLCCNG